MCVRSGINQLPLPNNDVSSQNALYRRLAFTHGWLSSRSIDHNIVRYQATLNASSQVLDVAQLIINWTGVNKPTDHTSSAIPSIANRLPIRSIPSIPNTISH